MEKVRRNPIVYAEALVVGLLVFLINAAWSFTLAGPLLKTAAEKPAGMREFLKWFPGLVLGFAVVAYLAWPDLPQDLKDPRLLAYLIIGTAAFLSGGMAFARIGSVTHIFLREFKRPFNDTRKEIYRVLEGRYPPEPPDPTA